MCRWTRRIAAAGAVFTRVLRSRAVAAFGVLLAGVASSMLATETPTPPPQPTGIVSRIERRPVESRALAAVGYSKRLRALEIEFKRGGTYRYLDVPATVYHALLAADSKAGFYNRHVRGKYKSVYVRPRRKR
jgi:hypothetical protein